MKEYLDKIGRRGEISLGQLRIIVTILDVKQAWGQIRWLVSPVEGSGAQWVESITLTDDESIEV